MNEAGRRPAYDEKERERIRRALQRYREQHGVGVPTLQLRIAEAIGDHDPERVPLKSLQRFLAATHRTDDALVDHCVRFLMTVAPPPQEERLADALTEFLSGEADTDIGSCAGRYHGRFTAMAQDGSAEKFGYSVLSLAASGHLHFLNAAEIVFNAERDTHAIYQHPDIFASAVEPAPYRYSGIFMPYIGGEPGAQSFLLLLRNYIHMRYCLLRAPGAAQPDVLEGHALEPPLFAHLIVAHEGETPLHMDEWDQGFRIEFTPVPAAPSKTEGVSKT